MAVMRATLLRRFQAAKQKVTGVLLCALFNPCEKPVPEPGFSGSADVGQGISE
jgi:hypothetical protein